MLDINNTFKLFFVSQLLAWHNNSNKRQLPWKQEKNPYYIWLSEIMLQQTQAQTVIPYYQKFIKQFPTIKHLAHAADQDVFKQWEGLGYYSRCKNLLFTARHIADHYKGVFPNQYKDILALKGVGEYTAAAIASFAFGLTYPVVDGNVLRVLSRFFGIKHPIDSAQNKKLFTQLSQSLIYKKNPAEYNQAIMDFGAQICTPKTPFCAECLLQNKCFAYNNNLQQTLPIKAKKIQKTNRYFIYFLFKNDAFIFLQQRTKQDIWQHLYEPFLIENTTPIPHKKIEDTLFNYIKKNNVKKIIPYKTIYKQNLTHQQIFFQFIIIEINPTNELKKLGLIKIEHKNIDQYPLPKTIKMFIKHLNLFI